jgi:aspartate/methionine/tyrosine aminotransferase
MKFANRTHNVAAFQVMELVKRAAELQAQGKPVIHMSIGEPDFTAPPAVVHALNKASAQGLTQYTSAVGIAPLRQAISRYYGERFNADIAPSRIIITAGASAALSLSAAALVNPGDRVLMTDPSYPCNRHFVAAFALPDDFSAHRSALGEKQPASQWRASRYTRQPHGYLYSHR